MKDYEKLLHPDLDRTYRIFEESGIVKVAQSIYGLLPKGSKVGYDNGPVWNSGRHRVVDTYPRLTISTPETHGNTESTWNVLEIRGSSHIAYLVMFIHEKNRTATGENSVVKIWSNSFSGRNPKDMKIKLYEGLKETFELTAVQDQQLRNVLVRTQPK